MKYRARLINHGKVLNRATFDADSDLQAYNGAHDEFDPPLGHWLEITRIRKPSTPVNPDKLAPKAEKAQKTAALRESFAPGQVDNPKDSRTAPPDFPQLPDAYGYRPAPGVPLTDEVNTHEK